MFSINRNRQEGRDREKRGQKEGKWREKRRRDKRKIKEMMEGETEDETYSKDLGEFFMT